LVNEIVQENVLFGYTAVGWLDEYSWFPFHFRGDRLLLPAGTKQHADQAQLVGFVEHILPHELYEQIEDTAAAEDSGWNVKATVEAINSARPENARISASGDYGRMLEDLQRESNLGSSLRSGAKVVILYNLLVYDINGKVTHWKVRYPDFKMVFLREDRFEKMSDVTAFFSFEQANGAMHGSKGAGRTVYNLAAMLDRSRNEVVDRLQLSGKIVLQGDPKQLARFKMGVFGNAVLISNEFEIAEKSIDPHVEEFFQLDQYITSIIDQLSGNTSPRHLQGERVTKAQVDLYAQREEEGKDATISRFIIQFARMMSTLQRRAVDPDVDDADALAMQERLLNVMSREELDTIAATASAGVVADLSDLERQRIIAVAAENAGNPLYDQTELARRKTTAQVDDEFAEQVLMPENDPTQAAEQGRLQLLENVLIQTGQAVPVSPRDNHLIHLQTLDAVLQPLVDSMQQGLENLPILKGFLQHATEHIQQGLASGENQAAYMEANQRVQSISEKLVALQAHQAAMEEGVQRGMSPEEAMAFADQMATGQLPPAAVQAGAV
ncbi:MAG TPA: hypothetical protein VMY18_12180, partial [Acidobacteriota bacterium]|nr:hypothetical protein [Acidobacteriota bacterium]